MHPAAMSASIEKARDDLAARLMRQAGVTAVGIGEHDGKPCIRVWVAAETAELAAAIPRSYAGHDVVVEVSGEIRALPGEE